MVTLPPDLSKVKGHDHAKRALEVAAAGRHTICLVSCHHGVGATLLARAYASLLDVAGRLEVNAEQLHRGVLTGRTHEWVLVDGLDRFPDRKLALYTEILDSGYVQDSMEAHLDGGDGPWGGYRANWVIGTAYLGGEAFGLQPPANWPALDGLLKVFDQVVELPPLTAEEWARRDGYGERSESIRRRLDCYCLGRWEGLDREARLIRDNAIRCLDLDFRDVERLDSLTRTITRLDGKARGGVAHVAEAVQYRLRVRPPWEVSL